MPPSRPQCSTRMRIVMFTHAQYGLQTSYMYMYSLKNRSGVMQMDFWCQLPGEKDWKTLEDLMDDGEFLVAVGLR